MQDAVARNVAPQHRVATTYLVNKADKMLAQDTGANRATFGAGQFEVLDNGDALPTIAAALGCTMRILRARSLTSAPGGCDDDEDDKDDEMLLALPSALISP